MSMEITDTEYIKKLLKPRKSNTHKGDYGRIMIVAGSKEMAGASVLSGKGAIKSGSGLVHVCTTPEIFHVIQISQPELICCSWNNAAKDLGRFDAIAIGPGLGVNQKTEDTLMTVLESYDGYILIDADGLNTVSCNDKLQKLIRNRRKNIILTPHAGEAERLLGAVDLKGKTMEATANKLYEKYGCNIVVKGNGSIVVTYSGKMFKNTTGNPGMATAGSGDVLTGIITSFLGQGLSPWESARAGVFIHGLAGDIAAEHYGQYGLTAGNIADAVPFAIKKILSY